jgi:signal recognition particle subunit SEC65
MTRMVQVAVAANAAEAEELESILREAGIECELECAVERDPTANEDAPQKVLVPENRMEDAIEAIEAMSEPDDLISDS